VRRWHAILGRGALLAAGLIAIGSSAPARANLVRAVRHASARRAYVDAGRVDGVKLGQTIELFRGPGDRRS
jgi:hypothetical protein